MRSRAEARIAICRCNQKERIYGVRIERKDTEWRYTWAFELNPETARREKYGEESVDGMLVKDPEYPGCPYCGAEYFIVCGSCGKLSCNKTSGNTFKCEWCGTEGTLSSYTGDGFCSGGDR